MKVLRNSALAVGAVAGALVVSACGSDSNGSTANGKNSPAAPAASASSCAAGSLSGAGSSFQDPMQQQWIQGYSATCSGAQINYKAVGSGSGINLFGQGQVDFAGSDVVMKSDEQAAADKRCGGSPAIHIPVTAGGVGVTYNLDGVSKLQLSPDTLADIFQGKLATWTDPEIKADNPGSNLPNEKITVFHRSDGSGTNSVFTSYLQAASSKWTLGNGKTVNWPSSGIGKPQNQGVSAAVKQTPGGVTYTEQAFAKQNNLPLAQVKNAGGKYVELTPEHVSKALESTKITPKGTDDLSAEIDYKVTDPNAYPISTVSYVIACSKYPAGFSGVAELKGFLGYAVTGGQQVANQTGFSPLPQALVGKDQSSIQSIS